MAARLDGRIGRLEQTLPDALAARAVLARIRAIKTICGTDLTAAYESVCQAGSGQMDDDPCRRLSDRELELLGIVCGVAIDDWRAADIPPQQRDALNALVGEAGRKERERLNQLTDAQLDALIGEL